MYIKKKKKTSSKEGKGLPGDIKLAMENSYLIDTLNVAPMT